MNEEIEFYIDIDELPLTEEEEDELLTGMFVSCGVCLTVER